MIKFFIKLRPITVVLDYEFLNLETFGNIFVKGRTSDPGKFVTNTRKLHMHPYYEEYRIIRVFGLQAEFYYNDITLVESNVPFPLEKGKFEAVKLAQNSEN